MLPKDRGDFQRLVDIGGCGNFDSGCTAGRLKAGYNSTDLEKKL